ncbi:AI-2E family transporter [Gordonia sp. TBRC 11910]|uniref:AI-2E family transporter n=1 Tax=Gordonia asplenii TaxID=2725283 RepID=A0A848L0A7_9ACTN|nr:AI-2E family transporter [Gordonia asplenii]NMO02495.1 AI-2E family transporter [Gordonia asplenii]
MAVAEGGSSGESPRPSAERSRAGGSILARAGLASWYLLGIVALVVVIAAALGAVSSILIPLVIAVILGIVLEPVAEALKRRGVPATVAVAITLLFAVAVGAVTVVVMVWGFVSQWPQIQDELLLGWNAAMRWVTDLDLDSQWLEHARSALGTHAQELAQGVLGVVTSTFYGMIALVVGIFFAAFFLFFVLRDSRLFPSWLARSTGLDVTEVDAVVDLSRQSVRGYFRGTAITALMTAPIFVIPLLILRIPLVIPIFILYFFLSFLPFVGAWITGVFAVLIAFGTGGPTAAVIILVTFVISNGTIQSAVSSWALGSSLRLHPISVLLATMIGGTVAGLIGMVLGAPTLAAVVKSVEAVRTMRRPAPHTTT